MRRVAVAVAVVLLAACPSEPAREAGAVGDAADAAMDTGGAGDAGGRDGADGPDAPAPPRTGFRRAGAHVIDRLGRVVMLHGVNVSNAAKRDPDHLTWHQPEDLQALADIGLDSVRYVLSWAAIMPAPGEVDAGWLDRVRRRLDWAHEAGLLVVLDMHQDLFGEGFGGNGAPRWACDEARYEAYVPTSPWWKNYLSPEVAACFDNLYGDATTWGHFVDAWRAVAGALGDHPAVVGFDLLNEPHWGTHDVATFVPEVWQPRQEALAAALHALAPDRVVFYETPPLLSVGLPMDFYATAEPDVGFAPHYYHPVVHEGGAYVPSFAGDIAVALDAMEETAGRLGGAPVWVGEIGAPLAAEGVGDYARALLSQLAERGWGWAWWSDDRPPQRFGIRDADGALRPEIAALLGHPYARRVPGPPGEQTLDFAGRRFALAFTWEVDAPLELWAPNARVEVTIDGGPAVTCAPAPAGPEGRLTCGVTDAEAARGRDTRVVIDW